MCRCALSLWLLLSPQSFLSILKSSASCRSARSHWEEQEILASREKNRKFLTVSDTVRISLMILRAPPLSLSPLVGSIPICFELRSLLLQFALPVVYASWSSFTAARKPSVPKQSECLEPLMLLCAEFPLLFACHVVLLVFLPPAIQIEVVSLQVCLNLSSDSGCGFLLI